MKHDTEVATDKANTGRRNRSTGSIGAGIINIRRTNTAPTTSNAAPSISTSGPPP